MIAVKIPKRISIRTAMMTTMCVCLLAAWISSSERSEDHRRALVAEFESRGSRISVSRIDGGWWAYVPSMFRPWQSDIRLNSTSISTEDLRRIDAMNCRIVGLKLYGTEYDDTVLRAIASVSSFAPLRDVGFYNTNVTLDGVVQFQRAFPNCTIHSHTQLQQDKIR